MKRLGLILTLLLTACESSRTINGKEVACYGLNGDPQPGYNYKYSTRNIVVSALTFQLLVPPIIVGLEELKCPVGETK